MADIFISYADSDRDRIIPIVQMLGKEGWSVWWDRLIPAGKTFDEVIEQAVNDTNCLVVVWTKESVKSRWVKTEAAEGAERGILIPILLDDVKVPFEFKRIQAAQLIDWNGDVNDERFIDLLSSITAMLGEPVNPDTKQIEKEDIYQPTNVISESSANDSTIVKKDEEIGEKSRNVPTHLEDKDIMPMSMGNIDHTSNELRSAVDYERSTQNHFDFSPASSSSFKHIKKFALSYRGRIALLSVVILGIFVATILVLSNSCVEPGSIQHNTVNQNQNGSAKATSNSPIQPDDKNSSDSVNRVVNIPDNSNSSPTPKSTPKLRPTLTPIPNTPGGAGKSTDVKLSASISVLKKDCDQSKSLRTQLKATPFIERADYNYTISGGRIIGSGPDVTWELKDAVQGEYTATVAISVGKGVDYTYTVVVKVIDVCNR